MPSTINRRDVLKAALVGASSLAVSGCSRSTPRSAVSSTSLVDLLETSKRDTVLEQLAPRIAGGLDAERLLEAYVVASTRTILTEKRFSVEQHTLLCAIAVYAASRHLRPSDNRRRWYPLLWAVDFFKAAQVKVRAYHDRPMAALAESRLPRAGSAKAELVRAFAAFDGERAEAAIVSLYRTAPRAQLIEPLLIHGSIDFRHIGHKVIHVANGLAALDVVGWQHAEPVLRSVARTLTLHYDEKNHDVDSAWRHSHDRQSQLATSWARGTRARDAATMREMLAVLRSGQPTQAIDAAVAQLNRGVGAAALWDAAFLSSAEALLNNPRGIEALHAVTSCNAAHATFRRCTSDRGRRIILLQSIGRVADFHAYVAYWRKRGRPTPGYDVHIDALRATPPRSAAAPLREVFTHIGGRGAGQLRAAETLLSYASTPRFSIDEFVRHALQLIAERAVDNHDFKLAIAMLQAYRHISAPWRSRYVAACCVRLRGSNEPAGPLTSRLDRLKLA